MASHFLIEDVNHGEIHGSFADTDSAMTELRRRSALAWDDPPNRAPCGEWRTCGREFYLLEASGTGPEFRVLRNVSVLQIRAAGVRWNADGNDPWAGEVGIGSPYEA
jgi:hypothetical protein